MTKKKTKAKATKKAPVQKWNFEVGGIVKISGKSYEIEGLDTDEESGFPIRLPELGWVRREFIQAYVPPVHQWLAISDLARATSLTSINQVLTERYGPPPAKKTARQVAIYR
jgi:hypothetical protein